MQSIDHVLSGMDIVQCPMVKVVRTGYEPSDAVILSN
jgi:hypothetical protein